MSCGWQQAEARHRVRARSITCDGRDDEQIPLAARLIAVVDTYSVMITDRPYQRACSSATALRELRRCAGTQFDPQVVKALINLLQDRQDQQPHEAASLA
jgi:HD-GYP domain-containing protein (c-di-GMP phosphodiesterase class II)